MLKCSLFAAHLTKSPTVSQDVQTFWNECRITITSYRDMNSYYYNGYTTLEVLDFDSSTMSDFRFDVKILKFSQTITNLVTLDFDSWQTPNPNKNLEEVILCPSITEIGYKCFSGYNKLKKINLENIHKLDRYAFDETSISSVTLPIDCTGEFVFLNCKNLKQITFDGERASFDLNLLKGFLKLPRISFTNNPLIAEKNYGIVWLQNNELSIYTETDINEFQIPDEIDSINTVAFSYLTKPLKVIVPPKLSDFMGVEYGETKITSIKYLSEDIYKLSDYAFAFWSKLQTVEFSSNIMALGYGSFGNCTELREINLPDVFAISDSAFYRCIKLEKISVPNVQVIGEYAFWHCDKLTSIEFPKEL
ncbi:hypothetical protein TVAG_133220 [Trichomonas vaginalis G3]|uniref:Surface antigen BspA-like n=1 Tax=Trichomonas vaginalis (strain ATCC PRA-98 / G3) TaxID=412133 RepID=A2EDJ9_TRIV3|nr:hypothetical protein TVAG_133220 [Trichomonas vaginalis G3]|eukprot:XP_001321487.1 hypothetical protein [Trichomonas vaginalis G3]